MTRNTQSRLLDKPTKRGRKRLCNAVIQALRMRVDQEGSAPSGSVAPHQPPCQYVTCVQVVYRQAAKSWFEYFDHTAYAPARRGGSPERLVAQRSAAERSLDRPAGWG
jgi:hypothetical protein